MKRDLAKRMLGYGSIPKSIWAPCDALVKQAKARFELAGEQVLEGVGQHGIRGPLAVGLARELDSVLRVLLAGTNHKKPRVLFQAVVRVRCDTLKVGSGLRFEQPLGPEAG